MGTIEIWRPVKTEKFDLTGYYEVSNTEKVRNSKTRKVLSKSLWGEYYRVSLQINGKSVSVHIHRLVCFAFPEICGEYFVGATVNHKDENKFNNKPENLEWVTQKENNCYGSRLERQANTNKENGKRGRVVVQYKNGLPFFIWKSIKEAVNITNYKQASISWALRSKNHYHNGFIWKYLDSPEALQ